MKSVMLGVWVLGLACHAWAQAPAPGTLGPHEPQELEAFLDGAVSTQLEAEGIPGAAVAVVRDGRLLLAKGYGYADLDRRQPVVADQTLFRVGSVSKLFTWTAVMQLAEQGRLGLDADINTFLRDFSIPATFPEPITLRHLMTHTSGFEDRSVGSEVFSADTFEPLGTYLARNLPARVHPPGWLITYSNHGTSLAGYVVEQVSGMPFAEYVERHIFEPLEMRHSTFRQPAPPELAPALSKGYESGAPPAEFPFEYLQVAPAGAISATVTDMANFMIAHLQEGRYGDRLILREATAQEMHRRHFMNDPRLDGGWALGFVEDVRNGQRRLWHDGGTVVFQSFLLLLPESGVGVFVTYNSPGSGGGFPPGTLVNAFLEHYYPAPAPEPPVPLADAGGNSGRFAGSYRSTRSSYTTIEKMSAPQGDFHVTAYPDGSLRVTEAGATPRRWVEVDARLFRPVGGKPSSERLAFREDAQGRITHLLEKTESFEKLPVHETATFSRVLLNACVAIFLTALGSGPLRLLPHTLPRAASWAARGFSLLALVFLTGLFLLMKGSRASWLSIPWVLGIAAGLLIPTLVVLAIPARNGRQAGVVEATYVVLVALAAVALAWWLNEWNVLRGLS